MSTVTDLIQTLPSRFDPSAASDLDAVFQFELDDAENFHIDIANKTCSIQQGDAADPSVTLSMDSATFVGVLTGETDGMQAFMSGKLRADGDIMLATRLGELFPQ